MNSNAEEYAKYNTYQHNIFREYFIPTVFPSIDKQDIVLDVGCGEGACSHALYSKLIEEKNFQGIIIGLDNDPAMIEYATKHFASQPNTYKPSQLQKGLEVNLLETEEELKGPRLVFILCDISSDFEDVEAKLDMLKGKRVNHIISSFCMHWIVKQEQALVNMCKLLSNDSVLTSCSNTKAKGVSTMDLLFPDKLPIVDYACQKILANPDWIPYTAILRRRYNSYQISWRREWMCQSNPIDSYIAIMVQAGFKPQGISVRKIPDLAAKEAKTLDERANLMKSSLSNTLSEDLYEPGGKSDKFFTEFAQYMIDFKSKMDAENGAIDIDQAYLPIFHYEI